MTLNEALSVRIQELLKENNMTQYALFKKSGVSAQAINKIIKQKNKMNALNIVYEIAQGFGMSLLQFFDSPLFAPENITD